MRIRLEYNYYMIIRTRNIASSKLTIPRLLPIPQHPERIHRILAMRRTREMHMIMKQILPRGQTSRRHRILIRRRHHPHALIRTAVPRPVLIPRRRPRFQAVGHDRLDGRIDVRLEDGDLAGVAGVLVQRGDEVVYGRLIVRDEGPEEGDVFGGLGVEGWDEPDGEDVEEEEVAGAGGEELEGTGMLANVVAYEGTAK
jgi:hypothetical protein